MEIKLIQNIEKFCKYTQYPIVAINYSLAISGFILGIISLLAVSHFFSGGALTSIGTFGSLGLLSGSFSSLIVLVILSVLSYLRREKNGPNPIKLIIEESIEAVASEEKKAPDLEACLPIPKELIQDIFSNLNLREIIAFSEVNKHANTFKEQAIEHHAKKFGFDEDAEENAESYLGSHMRALHSVKHVIPEEHLVYRKRHIPFLKKLDAISTYYNLKAEETTLEDLQATFNKALIDAVRQRNIKQVEALLLLGANPNCTTTKGNAPIHRAAKFGENDIIELLLTFGADISSRTTANVTALHEASVNVHPSTVKLLLSKGADPDLLNQAGSTPFTLAGAYNLYEVLKVYIESGYDVNTQDAHGRTALWRLVGSSPNDLVNSKSVKLLLEAGADPNILTNNGSAALSKAAKLGRTEMVQLLINAGATIDYQDPTTGYTALCEAVDSQNMNRSHTIARLLLKNGANPNIQTNNGSTPCSLITKNYFTDFRNAQRLKKYGGH